MAQRLFFAKCTLRNALNAAKGERYSLQIVHKRWLNLQEYQSKQLMRDNHITVQRFQVVDSVEEAKQLVDNRAFDFAEYVIKAQVLAGGRGKGHFLRSGMKSGVQLTKDKQMVAEITSKMLNDYLVTAQTTKEGVLVKKVMVAEALDIRKELYIAILLDRSSGGPVIVTSRDGGMNIEDVAKTNPESINKFLVPVDDEELDVELAQEIAEKGLGFTESKLIAKAAKEIRNLYKLFLRIDATQIEINPLGVTPNDDIVCFDAKIQFDENAEFRQKWIAQIEQENAETNDPREALAKEYNLNFVPMDGNIGCLVNGAGLAMATMDIIHHYGGSPANFLDVGGGVNQKGVENAFKLLTQDTKVKAILVNIFGGIVNCETVARGLIAAINLVNVPLIVRLEGTNQEAAKELLSKIPSIITADNLDDAAQKAVKMASSM
ncbi:GTP-specific succinyl-CoA synthetase: beta subunit-like protein [Dinothrombium tinctorium]|uniref:Succinate--CoA ligase [ADP-forming] subunit beta, mitochondrial n=1 Tax=Dinothrombium tinctorium TaxID=1965070 RepID=A0A3S4R337_9ACAR|nr:GTP-specific succinyl-CoA synthetase: beta subunit-like protein [Dinothrombium tinctorium]RWS10953.1 GTP-specific succinyl-CoA synthetase: beta subunit-like protein [Dinothrombium tinctorium]RWS10977.1 GTP-specific succinyl-CoA synthetase: beta subunit-like protein [Dinothrombium tinctorium]